MSDSSLLPSFLGVLKHYAMLKRDVLLTAMFVFFCSHKLMEKLHRMQMRAVSINGSAVYIYVHVHGTCISLTVLCVDAAICRTCGGEIIGAGKINIQV